MTDKNDRVEDSREFCRLYKTLAAAQTAAIDYVRGGTDQEMKQKAKDVADVFQDMISGGTFIAKSESGVGGEPRKFLKLVDCEDKCWDPVTQQCVDCLPV